MFKFININDVDDSLLMGFDCGYPSFNDFLQNKARIWQDKNEAVTYVCIDAEQEEITRIYAFATINSLGLLDQSEEGARYISCAEVRLFAIAKQLRSRHDPTITWSDQIFKVLLQDLYEMSTHIIGFRAIFLNANRDGFDLYQRNGFLPIIEYVAPTHDNKIDISECTPLLLIINDEMIENIFT